MFKRFWWVFLAMIPVGAIAGLLVAAVITYIVPKKYESEMVIEVKPMGGPSDGSQITPQFFGTEFEKIKSHDSLAKVVDHLELTNKWGLDKETAIRVLKGIVSTENIRGTDLISIRVRHTNKEDARDIAAEVGKAYREYHMAIQKRGEKSGLLGSRKAVQNQEDKLEERRKTLAKLARDSFTGPGSQDYIDAKREFEADKALLQSMKLKLINDEITAKMRDGGIVIHEEPQIPQMPVSPNVTLNLVLGTALGFLLSPLLSLPLMMLLNRLIPLKTSPTVAEMQ